MRRVFVILALLAMMAGLDRLKTQSAGGSDPLTLAAIGFVVLTAFAMAELGSRLSLPKVTGYILGGIVLGPFAMDVLSMSVVQELRMFSTLALGLIALTAGLELDLRGLRRQAKTLAVTIGIKVVTGIVLVGGCLVLVALTTDWLGPMVPQRAIALGLVFAALSLGTSPSIAVAIVTETKAKGRLTDLVMGAAVAKDLVVVIALALALAAARVFMGSGTMGAEVLVHVGQELGVSMAAGAILGGIFIAYIRWIGLEMLLVVAVSILVVAEIGEVLHLELLLVFIVAGAVVRNASPYEHQLLDPLQKISLPIFIVFFTNAGAGVDLGTTWSLLPVAVLLCSARAVGYILASRVGGRIGKEGPRISRLAWLAYLPQAGVTLGMIGVATKALVGVSTAGQPDLASDVASLGMAVVAINLLIGPVTLRHALRQAGEVSNAHEHEAVEEVAHGDDAAMPLAAPLAQATDELASVLDASWDRWREANLLPELAAWRTALRAETNKSPGTMSAITQEVMRRLDRLPALDAQARRQSLLGVLLDHLGAIETLPATIEVPLEDHHRRILPRDTLATQLAKQVAAVGALLTGHARRRIRAVPVRLATRATVEPAMAVLAEETLYDVQRFEVLCLECLQRVAQGIHTWDEGQRYLDELVERTTERVADNHRAAVARSVKVLRRSVAQLGAPAEWRRPVRYSRVAARIRDALKHLQDDSDAWTERRSAAIRTLRFVTEVERAELQLATDLERDVTGILDEAFAGMARLVDDEHNRIAGLPRSAEAKTDEEWERLGVRVRTILPKPTQRELRNIGMRVRRATSSSAPLAGALSFVADGDAVIRMMPSLHDMTRAPRPARLEPLTADVRELKEVQISGQLLPKIEQILEEAAQALAAIREGMREAASLIEFGFEAADAGRKTDPTGAAAKFDESVERALAMLQTLRLGACETWAKQRDALQEDVAQMSSRLFQSLATATGSAVERSVGQHPLTQAAQWLRRGADWVTDRMRHLVELVRAGETGQSADELALRYHLRTGGKRVDAQVIRTYLEDQTRIRAAAIEGLYASLFTAEPLRDPRLFVAHRDALNGVIKAARTWQADHRAGNGALVLGGSGSGKSSTLGIAQLKLGARRVLAIRRRGLEAQSLLDALSRALGCELRLEAVLRALRSQRSVVVLDDVHHWLPPHREGLVELHHLTRLMMATQDSTFFLVSMSAEAFEMWSRVVPLDQSFATVVRLQPVGATTLDAVIAARHELSGMELEFPTTLRARVAQRLLGRSIRTSFIRGLVASAGGNLRRALALWLAHANSHDVRVSLRPLQAFGWSLPFLQQLGPAALAVLAVLVRHGAQTEDALARFVGKSVDEIAHLTRFLVASGLVVREQGTPEVALTGRFVDDITRALAEHGILGGSS